jgi:Pro-kumamolisin, activation domain
MATDSNTRSAFPAGYHAIEGSERRPSETARKIGPADANEIFSVSVVLRRRPGGPPVPDHDYFLKTAPRQRQRMPNEEFAKLYGASPEDIAKVKAFAQSHHLTVVSTNAARRVVKLRGSVAQMSAAFVVELGHYEHEVQRGRRRTLQTEAYRGRDGFVHVPNALKGIVVGVFGLDNRRVGGRNGSPEPPNTTTLAVPTVSALYNYPTNSAAGQTIGIVSLDGYDIGDITAYFAGLPAGYTAPTVTDIGIDGATNTGFDPYGETTQDISISAAFAPGAAINVYFCDGSQQGWVDLLGRVAHPDATDMPASVLSSSFFIADGDDGLSGVTITMVNAVSAAFLDCAIQGVTVCMACGDRGTDSNVRDGNAHVQYPASDPWVLSIGGTTIGNVSGSSFEEYVWNDTGADPTNDNWGTTGGGVSQFFPAPDYQSGVTIPASISQPGFLGRGVPDVAGNANIASGYDIILYGSPGVGSGTSASAPQWAGLIAVINAALGVDVGFVNPAIYALGSGVFRDIVPGAGPADNSNSGVAGYPAGPGWDACTGWGSPNGQALLDGLRTLYTRNLYFVVDKSTFGVDEVGDVIAHAGGVYSSAFWLVLEGVSVDALGDTVPDLSGAFAGLNGITVFLDSTPSYENAGELYTPQRIRFSGNIIFTNAALMNDFPAAGGAPNNEPLIATLTVGTTVLVAETVFELVSGADPYFTNIDPSSHQYFYLSQDLRVFTAAAGDAPLPGTPAFTSDPYASIQSLLHFMNHNATYTTPGAADHLNTLPGQSGYETGDSSVTPLNGSGLQNFGFAIARVRLQGPAGSKAQKVRVFFRLFVAQSCDTDFDPNGSYKRQTGMGAETGLPVFPLPSGDLSDPGGNSLKTIPFFATDAIGSHDYDGMVMDANVRDITIPPGKDRLWAYFGCYLDVYDASNQSLFPGTHHCIVAEIAYDETPIQNSNGVTLSPENTDKLAQRNLQITSSGNPGYPDTHRIPQTFDTRASAAPSGSGQLLDYPDELMIDWGNVPAGSTAHIYWPQVDAHAVLKLAASLYGTHRLRAADPHTIACRTTKGVSYIPIPYGTKKNFAGLFTIDLPNKIHAGQEFNVRVRRITSRRAHRGKGGGVGVEQPDGPPPVAVAAQQTAPGKRLLNWRYVTGTFQVKIPVGDDKLLLQSEESTLAILKWRLQQFSSSYRWRPVVQRYIEYLSRRVRGFGGDPETIKPSPWGIAPGRDTGPGRGEVSATGKVAGLVYDRFGDFEGFTLETEHGETRSYRAREAAFEELAREAWFERIVITVLSGRHEPHHPVSIVFRRAPWHCAE